MDSKEEFNAWCIKQLMVSEAYATARTNILVLLAEIEASIETTEVDHPDFGHVGTMNHIMNQLQDISDQLNNTGEYTPAPTH